MAVAALNDIAENQCRAGEVDAGLLSARQAYGDSSAIFGQTGGTTQAVGMVLAECLIAAHQYDAAKPFLNSIDIPAISVALSDPDADAEINLMKAQIAFAGGDITVAYQLLVRPRQVFGKTDADLYFRRVFTALNTAMKLPKDSAH